MLGKSDGSAPVQISLGLKAAAPRPPPRLSNLSLVASRLDTGWSVPGSAAAESPMASGESSVADEAVPTERPAQSAPGPAPLPEPARASPPQPAREPEPDVQAERQPEPKPEPAPVSEPGSVPSATGVGSLPPEIQRSLRAAPMHSDGAATAAPETYRRYLGGTYGTGGGQERADTAEAEPSDAATAGPEGPGESEEPGEPEGTVRDDSNQEAIRRDYARQLQEAIRARQQYPTQAVRRRQEGTVRLHFRLLANGTVDDVSVIGSSGHRALDDAARQLLNNLEPLPPLPDSSGQAAYLTFELPVVYRLR